jgi:hypothetical protein
MTESLLNARQGIAVQDPDGVETQSTFDRLLRDYFGPQVVRTMISMSDSHTPSLVASRQATYKASAGKVKNTGVLVIDHTDTRS